MRQGTLKYVAEGHGETDREHLFDLVSDLAEKKNLKNARPEDFVHLRQLYNTWEETVRRNRRGRPEWCLSDYQSKKVNP